jgi:hypothetical protein
MGNDDQGATVFEEQRATFMVNDDQRAVFEEQKATFKD